MTEPVNKLKIKKARRKALIKSDGRVECAVCGGLLMFNRDEVIELKCHNRRYIDGKNVTCGIVNTISV